MNTLKYVAKNLAGLAVISLSSGALIYLIDKPLKGLTNLQSAELMAVSVAIALPICFALIIALDEFLERR